MTTELAHRAALWVLIAAMLAVRAYFSIRVRRAGERVMPDRGAVEREGAGLFATRVLMFLFLLVWLALYAVYPSWMDALAVSFPGWLRWAGFAMGLASLGLLIWTQVALGKEWSPQLQLRAEHHLVTSGPYARVRHPLYAAGVGYVTSLALVTANLVFIAFALATVAGLLIRTPKEEEMMVQEFGDEYRAYMERTGRFFPR